MTRKFFLPCCFLLLGILSVPLQAADDLEPTDPIAAVDGEAIYLGEMNLVLTERLKVRDLGRVEVPVQQATATLLVRRHLAMKSLREDGGESLQNVIDRQLGLYVAEAKRRGSSLEEQAKARKSDSVSLKADLAWRTAWAQYLKSRMTSKNLRLFFDGRRDRYGGSRWQVSQVFVKMDTSDPDSVETTRVRMEELADEIRASGTIAQSFAEAATSHSDAGTAADGGKVGWVEKDGDLPKSVMAVVRLTAVGAISKPVRSPLGMHLLFVSDRKVGKQSFEDLADQSQLRRDASNALFDALVARQKDAKVTWFIGHLRPPQNVSIFP
ncbi:MAG: peptidylprolyl isomerase [Rubripirellula sp.]